MHPGGPEPLRNVPPEMAMRETAAEQERWRTSHAQQSQTDQRFWRNPECQRASWPERLRMLILAALEAGFPF